MSWTRLLAGLVVLLAVMPGCITTRPSTRLAAIQRDPAFRPDVLRRMLVIGVLPNPDRRRMFEALVASEFRQRGMIAVRSYESFPTIDGVTRATLEPWVRQKQISSVLITRLIDRKTVETSVPGSTSEVPPDPLEGPLAYYNESAKVVTTPGYTVDQTVAVLETKVFETAGGKNVWTCRSETLINGYLDDLIRSFAEMMAEALYAPADAATPDKGGAQ